MLLRKAPHTQRGTRVKINRACLARVPTSWQLILPHHHYCTKLSLMSSSSRSAVFTQRYPLYSLYFTYLSPPFAAPPKRYANTCSNTEALTTLSQYNLLYTLGHGYTSTIIITSPWQCSATCLEFARVETHFILEPLANVTRYRNSHLYSIYVCVYAY